ncbi:uncharacterized protein, partial [Prorops nasuta]|uniref:uncharacterized protein n=1 Tax=Prorops nasuta TaxID=863751 RepID=UPI0034CF99FC
QEPESPVQWHLQEQEQERQQKIQQHERLRSYLYELQDTLAKLRISPYHNVNPINPVNQGYHNDVFLMTYNEENENEYNYNDYRLPPPLLFRYDSSIYSPSPSITDGTYDSGNNNAIRNYDENDYDDVDVDVDVDVDDESPRKGLLKQMFCLPLK